MTPHPGLLSAYGTHGTFLEKAAGELPLGMRMGAGLLGFGLLRRQDEAVAREAMQARRMNEALRELELLRMQQAIANARHTQVPMMAGDMPLGLDEGMVRMASQALQKEAGLGVAAGQAFGAAKTFLSQAPKPQAAGLDAGKLWNRTGLAGGAWKWKLPALAGAYMGYKGLTGGVKKGLGYLSGEPHPANYGQMGPSVPAGVNQYGQPQMGTPFMSG
jgi:hypothetical protein